MTALITVTLDSDQIAAGIVAAAALAAGVAYFTRWVVKAGRVLFALHELAERELTHNHGSSMKDDTVGTAEGLGVLSRLVDGLADEVDDINHRLTQHLKERRT
jgi:hypothetical protein